jgi:pimeloyl-ACP methyl ester carboxylesterase
LASPALISDPTFDRFTDLIEGPLAQLGVANAYLYVHDFGTPVALNLAMRDPRGVLGERQHHADRGVLLNLAMRNPRGVLGLIVQNANAHRTGLGRSWRDTIDYWHAPTAENEQGAAAHLTFEGTQDQFIGGLPDDIAARNPADNWIDDWRVMCEPVHLALQSAPDQGLS